jgi:ABC-type glycerol-3-phosphate transport system substrate-binding protein
MKKTHLLWIPAVLAVLFTACGNKKASGASAGEFTARAPAEYSGTITLWSWTDDPVYQITAFNKVYPNVKVEFTQVGEGYDTKIQAIVDNNTDGPDIFVADVKVVKNYIDTDAWENLSAAPYSANSITSEIMSYTKEVASDGDGNLRALSWQATPGAFWYKRSLAKEYLGTDDPVQVSAMMSSIDGFLAMAETIKTKSGGESGTVKIYERSKIDAVAGNKGAIVYNGELPARVPITIRGGQFVVEYTDKDGNAATKVIGAAINPLLILDGSYVIGLIIDLVTGNIFSYHLSNKKIPINYHYQDVIYTDAWIIEGIPPQMAGQLVLIGKVGEP